MSKPAHGAHDPSDPAQYMSEGQQRVPQTELNAESATLDQFARANYENTCFLITRVTDIDAKLEEGEKRFAAHAASINDLNARLTASELSHRDEASEQRGADKALAPYRRVVEIAKNLCVGAVVAFVIGAVGWVLIQFTAATHPTTATQSTTLTTTVSPPPKAN